MTNPDFNSEDDARTESTDTASLVGHSGPDDVFDLDETESNSEVGAIDTGRDVSDSQEISPNAYPTQPSLHSLDSTITPDPHASDSIEFEEPERWPDVERVELKHTVHFFDEEEVAEIAVHSPPELLGHQLFASVRMTMTREDLRVTRPFRILYLGGHQEIKSAILTKIGDALVANAGLGVSPTLDSSMYHVLQTSYHPGSSPTELVPIDAQLVVDECVAATSQKTGFRQADQITLAFKKGQSWSSVWDESSYIVQAKSQWTPPDIAVFFIPEQEAVLDRQSRTYAHVFMNRHNIPTMMISEKCLWRGYKGVMPFDHKSLHGCVESRASSRTDSRVLKRLPIDLNTFQSIIPGQLNRNLACLTGLYARKNTPAPSTATSNNADNAGFKSFPDIEKYPLSKSIYAQRTHVSRMLKTPFVLGILATIVALVLGQSLMTIGHIYSSRSSVSVLPAALSSSVVAYPPSMTGPSVLSPNTIAPPKNIATVDSKRELQKLLTPELEAANKSDKFQVYVIGDCHMIIKPPRYFASKKKVPAFHVQISRGDQALSHNLSRLFDGVFTTQLDREEAYGPINVTITTMKPLTTQMTEVDFGTPWLKIASWKKAAQMVSAKLQKDVDAAQKELAVIVHRVSTDLQVRLQAAREIALDHAVNDHKVLHAKSKALVEVAKVQTVAVSKRVTKEVSVASTYLAKQLEVANREVAVFVKYAWHTAYEKGVALHQASSQADLGKTFQDARRSKVLATAQERAARLVKHSAKNGGKPEIPAAKSMKPKKPLRKGKHNR